ncbi:MAG TPA: ABC transporter permease [Vicinamibacterales bacterium]|nr:ABC transporter permease [Vicinamibacterales bacterium]
MSSNYFRTLGVTMAAGRDFTPDDERPASGATVAIASYPVWRRHGFAPAEDEPGDGPRVAIVDRRLAARLFGDADPVGRQIRMPLRDGDQPESCTVVGVAAEMRHNLFEDAPEPHVYVPYGSRFSTVMNLRARLAPGAADGPMLAALRREIQSVDAQLPILSATTMDLHRGSNLQVWSVRAAATMFSSFGVLALLLATIGVYGLKAYDVSRGTREIGIRMALGATPGDVERLVMREGLRTTAIGVVIGLALAAGIGRLVSRLLYHVHPFDPATLALAVVVLSAATMLASFLPARRATCIAPTEALRAE